MTSSRSRQPGNGRQFASASQVAELAGVSRSAVSRAFTPGASISEQARERVMQAAQQLGYQVNDLARALLHNRSRLVGLVVTNPEEGFRAHLTAALTQRLVGQGWTPIVINTGKSAEELLAAQRALLGYRADATVVLSGSPPSSLVDLARRNGQALILLGREESGAAHVRIDNRTAAHHAAHLFAEQGYAHVALVGSESRTPSVLERESGFLHQARQLGLEVRHVRGSDSTYTGGQEAAAQLLPGSGRLAAFCVNDLMAFGLMDAARHRFGLRVPDDLAIIGFDDLPEAAWNAYQLTTFRQDPWRMADAVAATLDSIEESGLPATNSGSATISLPAPLVARASFPCGNRPTPQPE
ncbi:LacI family DNA-binding transcriptional regulator [Pseudomonas sp. S 311-6]|jgi:DNA-binding LacI/PurR family transcriptional regulator|uniref:Transcriptional regulator n=1 Tax=Kerstersia gyiorum TaxID=206506 RepID=A0A171KTQ3_9BURK|nr:LacI family DNA-binding transcriptional regulator [Kerstersia gyiorum]AZV93665.1 transcriptional regulator [Bordetella sp. J329]MCO7640186.1 LacI family DNA-binding transcriptional regulator [Pseudomonas sp. S 311-6]KAB0543266.1 LacI family DNA-binding transcriptional regulator [Kerstersia gyiorum]KKO72270.1 transcriptional regulator [Kerstersia gyiorum]MCH4271879.1 LacI family DNA-binding transcriptional regulator [Kerstersia gyiorum]